MKPETLTIREIFGGLKVSQLWAIGGAIVAIISSAYALGYKTATIIDSDRIGRLGLERDRLEAGLTAQQSDLEELETKDLFLSLYLRYQLTKEAAYYASAATNDDLQKYKLAREAFDAFLQEKVGQEKLTLRKGQGRQATMVFADGTVWTIPKEMHMALAD